MHSTLRIKATKALQDAYALKQEEAAKHQSHAAEVSRAELQILEAQAIQHEAEVKEARRVLAYMGSSPPPTSKAKRTKRALPPPPPDSPFAIQEALRETARDCVRREALRQAELHAHREAELASRRVEESHQLRLEQSSKLRAKQQQEEESYARKVELEQIRMAAAHSTANDKRACQDAVDLARKRHEEKLADDRKARLKAKEAKALQAEEEKKKAALEKERELATRAKTKDAQKAKAKAEADAELARKMEVVWREAEGVAARCHQALDTLRLKRSLLAASADGEAEQRLEKRLQAALERAASAKQAFELAAGKKPEDDDAE